MGNKELLEKKYDELRCFIGINTESAYNNINIYIRKIINDFFACHKRVAIYCYGVHTQMLMADFIADLRDTVCIIDNGNVKKDGDFRIIKDEEIEENNHDGIIISSFRLRNEIKQGIRARHSSVDVLDIYSELEGYGVYLEKEFYNKGPYQLYTKINNLVCQIASNKSVEAMKDLLEEYIYIKEFRLAKELAVSIFEATGDSAYEEIRDRLEDLYKTELSALEGSGKNNTLMLLLDGMRRDDFFGGKMKKTLSLLEKTSSMYRNAYSYSTMTYESLVPAFSENTDQRTEYYLSEEVASSECRFIKKALDEKRFVAVYGDGNHYIYDESIKYSGRSQTVTEKLWDFVLDASENDYGVFYFHELYESHYSFPNPYTKRKIVSNDAAMLFDYLPQQTGRLRTDYKSQQRDALEYLDDTLEPFIRVLPCNMVLFSDHGNLILDSDAELKDVRDLQLHASEEWIRIPLVIKVNGFKHSVNNDLISLLDINDIMLSVLSREEYVNRPKEWIKIGRSTIYNPQFKDLYSMLPGEYNGEAFEGFVFNDGYKLIVFSNGKKELYRIDGDVLVNNTNKIEELFEKIKNEVTCTK